jgi:hypothetical protein
MGRAHHYTLDPTARDGLGAWLAAQPRGPSFGNARLVRNVFEQAITTQASRLVELAHPTDEQLVTLVAGDLPAPGVAT